MRAHVIAVTGAGGFIGSSLVARLVSPAIAVRGFVRRLDCSENIDNLNYSVTSAEINAFTYWKAALTGVDCVIHCAARAHVTQETEADPLAAYRHVNVAGTRRLAEEAVDAGVRRLVFLSSIGVLGLNTSERGPFLDFDPPGPLEDYAVSKWEAERALWDISAQTGLEVVVVRPPLVYGPGVKGNLLRLLKLLSLGVPLPLGAVQNKRSLIGLDNLVDLLIRCVYHPAAAGETFLVSDGEDLSTPDLLSHMAAAMGRSVRLFPVPVPLLRLAGAALGKRAEIDRLVGSLQIDSSHTRQVLGWVPPVSVQEGIRRMVQGA
jgi:nucleoside-diphosphate-sugar epimerase